MSIKIIDAAEAQVDKLILMLYANPNAGKTTLAFTTDKPLLLDFDGGAHRAGNRAGKALVRIKAWSDIAAMRQDDLKDFNTIIVDTVGTCLDRLAGHIMREDAKMGSAGALTLKGFGALKARFRGWLDFLQDSGKDVVLIAHLVEEMRGDETVERIVASGSSKQEVYREADMIGRIIFRNKQRVLTFDPSEAAYGKNCGLDEIVLPWPLPDDTLGKVIVAARDKMNDSANEAIVEQERLDKLKADIGSYETVEDFNTAVKRMIKEKSKPIDRKLLRDAGEALGFVFDTKKKVFTDPNAKPAGEEKAAEQDGGF